METLIEYAALAAGAGGLLLVVLASLGVSPGRKGAGREDRFVPGNFDPHSPHGDSGHSGGDDGGPAGHH